VFGELGATYLIIPHVSLGVIASVDARFARTRSYSVQAYSFGVASNNSTSRGYSLDTELLSVVATVYF